MVQNLELSREAEARLADELEAAKKVRGGAGEWEGVGVVMRRLRL